MKIVGFTLLVALAAGAVPCLTLPTGAVAREGALPDLRVARGTRGVSEAWLADATTRYQHFVLGSRYEAASLAVRLPNGRLHKLTLPETSVFEDRQPRLADLDGDGTDEIIVVRSYLGRGRGVGGGQGDQGRACHRRRDTADGPAEHLAQSGRHR